MPNVPNVPGVPRLTSFSSGTVALLVADVVAAIAAVTSVPRWGVLLAGVPVIDADSFVSLGLRQDFPVSDYQVEKGAFQSYNKVQLPTEIRVRYSAGGSDASRQAFLNSIDAVMNTVDLYDVLTPERLYTGYNFTHRDFERTAKNGVGLITVDLWLTQIREGATATFSSTQRPGQAAQQGVGAVQPQATSPTSQGQVTQALGAGGS
jgi:hypothetical protein